MYKRSKETGRLKKSRSFLVLSPISSAGNAEVASGGSPDNPSNYNMSNGTSTWIKRCSEDENLVLVVEDWKKKKKRGADLLKHSNVLWELQFYIR